VLFAFRELLNARRGEVAAAITAEHGKVLADADGEVQRGLEVVEYACGIPQLLKGGFSRTSRPTSTPTHPPAARRRGRHQPVQLPGDGAAVVRADGDRCRQRVDPQAEREGPRPRRT
jgi:acyl-CoA reductase-like NAD-dependent aldehyde dehydrogenase